MNTSNSKVPRLVVPATETGALLQSTDWSRTPLGPMEGWPQSLRIAVGICLNSRFPMFVWWGSELINIYNDAYIPILGKRHPQAFGRPARGIWGEIWPVVGPQAEAVMQRGEATWNERVLLVMERHGYTESTWFTWSYSPIPYDGGIGGVFCACTEDTPRVLVERERDLLLARAQLEHKRLAEAFTQSPAFLAVMRGPQHVFESANERYLRLTGRDLIGKPVRKALPEIEGQGFFEILDHVYATGKPFIGTSMRLMLSKHAGEPLEETYVDFVYQPLRAADGTVTGILVHGVDVTEQKRIELRAQFLLALDEAVRALTEPAQITATCARLLGEHLRADRCAYADVEPDENTFNLTGDYNRGVPSIVGRYRFSDFGAEALRLMREGNPYVVTDVDRHQPPLGELTYYRKTMIQSVICVPLHKGGKFVAAMAVHQRTPRTWLADEVDLLRTVASRCWESIERARVARSLAESEASFRQLADAMPQIVFAARPDGHVDYFNHQWYEYTGLRPGEVGYDSWKQVHTEDGLRRVEEKWAEAVRTGGIYEIEYPLRRHDGALRWHLGRALPIRDAQGNIVRWLGTNTDIHERKQFEESLREAHAEAERASRMKDEFLATLSHELRTPLNAILGWAQILKLQAALPPELAQGVDVIERNARAQGTIINDLLDMSAIISGKVRLHMQPVDLAELARTAVEAARPTATAKHIEMAARIAPGPAMINGDASRLQQVLWNLLTNAVKFTPGGGRVEVSLAPAGDEWVLRVADTGEGIHGEFLPFIFDRFRQGDASKARRHGGLGLGLSIVKQLVELHGGSAAARSEGKGKGAEFTVRLPVTAARREQDTPAKPAGTTSSRSRTVRERPADVAGIRVLVVDDDGDARELLRKLLEDERAAVTTARSAREAAALLAEQRFDVLVSDIGMPGEDGYALMRRVRHMSTGRHLPAIAVSAYAGAEDRVQAVRAGFQVHLAKPVEPAELLAMVASLTKRL